MTEADVRLTALTEADAEVLFEWINSRELVTHSAAFRPVHECAHLEWFRDIQKRSDTVIFGVRDSTRGRLLGSAQLLNIHPVHRSAELQIRIGEASGRDKGLGTQSVRQLVDFGFRDMNLHRIYLRVFESNERARRVYEKVGFAVEGQLREAAYVEGRFVDLIVMALLRDQWLSARAAQAASGS